MAECDAVCLTALETRLAGDVSGRVCAEWLRLLEGASLACRRQMRQGMNASALAACQRRCQSLEAAMSVIRALWARHHGAAR
ncbi:EscE/YscE/SsaE family type III secretion system needle protein co-chaperone [Paludibacterium sp. B53371]|uniref:EscE/YscE/SsaE family type III secretion system needle protein co-chaperone n=1 Tax=Paludibacterium sp. B53371 TaxID=2806263 RepID=UPI001C05A5E5|nr:EscE/YscE/SsaE family type III secretion system needle protein co-chaperone [Paludibacterium sp. B53371]